MQRTLTTTAIFAISAGSAHAAISSFQTNTTVNEAPKGDIILQSVLLTNGSNTLITDIIYADQVVNLTNTPHTGGNTGAASTDHGDNVVAQNGITDIQDPTATQIRDNLASNNINSIIDTEDKGFFSFDIMFNQPIEHLLIWERGKNSKLGLQAINAQGDLVGDVVVVDSRNWDNAGFKMNTTEIKSSQKVGSLAILDFAAFFNTQDAITGVNVYTKKGFNGPDFKLVAANSSTLIPAPGAAGLLALAGLTTTRRRRS